TEHVRWTGAIDNVAQFLAAADVLVSTSAYEGLSLAQLEALAAGIPVVATDVGGTAEIAHYDPACHLQPPDAGPERFAAALAALAARPRAEGRSPALGHFGLEQMARRHAWLYPLAIEAARGCRQGKGVLLVTNNFSTGGAQSSARRLLIGLAA